MARILIVEDEPYSAQIAAVICEAEGHSVAFAENGRQALELIARERFDLVLLDILMPVMDGVTVLRELRRSPVHCTMPVLAVTALSSRSDELAILGAGADRVLAKPYRAQTLRVLLAHLLALGTLRQEAARAESLITLV